MVVDGRVHEDSPDPPERQPAQRVEHEGAAEAGALGLGVDGEALQESLVRVAAADGVTRCRTIGSGHDPGPVPGRGVAHVVDCRRVEAPLGAECADVDAAGDRMSPDV